MLLRPLSDFCFQRFAFLNSPTKRANDFGSFCLVNLFTKFLRMAIFENFLIVEI